MTVFEADAHRHDAGCRVRARQAVHGGDRVLGVLSTVGNADVVDAILKGDRVAIDDDAIGSIFLQSIEVCREVLESIE